MKLNMGVMQMATFVLTPDEKDIPVLSADYMFMLPIRKTYLEIYDLVINNDDTYKSYLEQFDEIKSHYADIPDTDHSETWDSSLIIVSTYKHGNSGNDNAIAEMLAENVRLMLRMADEYPALSEEEVESKRKSWLIIPMGLLKMAVFLLICSRNLLVRKLLRISLIRCSSVRHITDY